MPTTQSQFSPSYPLPQDTQNTLLKKIVQALAANLVTMPGSQFLPAFALPQDTNNTLLKKMLVLILAGGGGGAGGGVPTGNYAGGQPTFTPTTAGAVAIDSSNGRIWWYFNGAWQ
jgi:hypothetical protein